MNRLRIEKQLIDKKLSFFDPNKNLTNEEYEFIVNNLHSGSRKNHSFGILPYVTQGEQTIVDSIAKKLRMRKFFRGPRRIMKTRYLFSISRYMSSSTTLKEDALEVALYPRQ